MIWKTENDGIRTTRVMAMFIHTAGIWLMVSLAKEGDVATEVEHVHWFASSFGVGMFQRRSS
eukprot:4547171-Amphidinium_carterae.1